MNIQPLQPWATLRKWKTIQPSNVILSWVLCSLLVALYWKKRSTIQSEFSRRWLKLHDIAHVSFYISTRPGWKQSLK